MNRPMLLRFLGGFAAITICVGAYNAAFDRHEISEIEAAIQRADILRRSPDDVIARLRDARLSWNDRLDVSWYDHGGRRVGARAYSPMNNHDLGWSVRVDVQFDESDRASKFVVRKSAQSPF